MPSTRMRQRLAPDVQRGASRAVPAVAIRVAVTWPVATRDAVRVLELIQVLYNALGRYAQPPGRRRSRAAGMLQWTVASDGRWTLSGDAATCATLVQIWRQCRAVALGPEVADAGPGRASAWDRVAGEVRRGLPGPDNRGRDVGPARVTRALWQLLQAERRGLVRLDDEETSS